MSHVGIVLRVTTLSVSQAAAGGGRDDAYFVAADSAAVRYTRSNPCSAVSHRCIMLGMPLQVRAGVLEGLRATGRMRAFSSDERPVHTGRANRPDQAGRGHEAQLRATLARPARLELALSWPTRSPRAQPADSHRRLALCVCLQADFFALVRADVFVSNCLEGLLIEPRLATRRATRESVRNEPRSQ